MSKKQYDLIVIGAGPGGYVAAIRGAQLGMNVAIIEKRKTLGGTCLNVGCIPSKALLDSSEHFHQAQHKFKTHGIDVKDIKVNFKQMIQRKTDVVAHTTKGIDFLMDKNKIDRYEGIGAFETATTVKITNGKSSQVIEGTKIIVATGSDVAPLPTVPFDGKSIISSTEALELSELPKSMIIVGGGVIGVEMGSIYARLGTEVTIVEFFDRIIPGMDKELSRTLLKSLKGLGITFHLGTKVTASKVSGKVVTLTAETQTGETLSLKAEKVLVSIGRRPYTESLELDKAGIKVDDRGRIPVNAHFQTTASSVYAIGDVIAGPMLAHKASEEASVCVEYMVGQKPHLNYKAIPSVVYTWPEVAGVGDTEEQLKESGIAYKVGKFSFKASGRARAAEESEGFIKVLSDKNTDEILGIHMVGPRCADIIGTAVTALEYRASAEDIARMTAAHPTYMEALKEAALAATDNRAIHM